VGGCWVKGSSQEWLTPSLSRLGLNARIMNPLTHLTSRAFFRAFACLQCAKNLRWGGAGGWPSGQIPPNEVRNEVMTGQNLEDAVIAERFFRSGPLAHLSHGDSPGGMFLEMGALDGITFSNTRLFEHCLGWDGLLIEAQPTNAEACRKNRPCAKLYAGGVCAPPQKTLRMSIGFGTAFDLSLSKGGDSEPFVEVPCKPLSEVLVENNITRINFFSLDVEGAELLVLKTIDWSAVQIDVLMVETDFSKKVQKKTQGENVIDDKNQAVLLPPPHTHTHTHHHHTHIHTHAHSLTLWRE
jgi:FkbM family methyltransferase